MLLFLGLCMSQQRWICCVCVFANSLRFYLLVFLRFLPTKADVCCYFLKRDNDHAGAKSMCGFYLTGGLINIPCVRIHQHTSFVQKPHSLRSGNNRVRGLEALAKHSGLSDSWLKPYWQDSHGSGHRRGMPSSISFAVHLSFFLDSRKNNNSRGHRRQKHETKPHLKR